MNIVLQAAPQAGGGNFTFLIITDREDLDTQIHKTFVRSEVIGDKEECQPKNAAQLREFLGGSSFKY